MSRHRAPSNFNWRNVIVPVAAAVALLTAAGVHVVDAATTKTSAACTAAPSVTYTAVTAKITMVCTIPLPASVPTSPTPTDTVTPTPTPTGSTVPPAAFPDAASTGPTGALAKSPAIVTSRDGQVIENIEIDGCNNLGNAITVQNNNVVIRNVLVRATCFFLVENDTNTGLQITDTELDGLANKSDTTIGGQGWTGTRLDIHGSGDGLKLGQNTTLRDSYIHDLVGGGAADHNDGAQLSDGANITVDHNTIVNQLTGGTSAILVKADFGPIDNLAITNNYLAGGAWTLYAGNEKGNCGCGPATHVTVTGNEFSTQVFPKGGAFGPLTDVDPSYVVAGNVWADGPNKGKAVN